MTRTTRPQPEMLWQVFPYPGLSLPASAPAVFICWVVAACVAGSDSAVFTAGNNCCAFPPPCVPNECSNSKAFLDTDLIICATVDEDAET